MEAIDAVCVLKDLSYARSRIEFWSERRELASVRLEAWRSELKRLEAKNKGETFEAVPYTRGY